MGADELRYRVAEQRYFDAEGVTPTERWLRLDRARGPVRVQEMGDGPPVLFVHGVNNAGTSWVSLAARLDGFRCLLLDRPGCGLSGALAEPVDDMQAMAAVGDSLLVEVLDALDLDRAHLVATSLGGYHALRTALAHPDRVSRLLLLGWTVGAPNGDLPLVMRLTGVRSLGRLMAAVPVNDRAVRSLLARIGLRQALEDDRLPQEGIDWFRALINHTNTMRNELDATPPIVHLRLGLNDAVLFSDDVLGRIRVPVQFLWGAEDPFGGADVARVFATRVPGATLELVPRGGHAVWLDDPELVASRTTAFLTAADRA